MQRSAVKMVAKNFIFFKEIGGVCGMPQSLIKFRTCAGDSLFGEALVKLGNI